MIAMWTQIAIWTACIGLFAHTETELSVLDKNVRSSHELQRKRKTHIQRKGARPDPKSVPIMPPVAVHEHVARASQ